MAERCSPLTRLRSSSRSEFPCAAAGTHSCMLFVADVKYNADRVCMY